MEGPSSDDWKTSVFFIHDQLECKREEDPPENAIVTVRRATRETQASHPIIITLCRILTRPGLDPYPAQFLAPVEVDLQTQAYLCGGLTAMANFSSMVTGTAPTCFRTKNEKIALYQTGQWRLCLSGELSEPDRLLSSQLVALYKAFIFYHGSFHRAKEACGNDRKRFSSAMTRVWSGLLRFYRPQGDALHSGFLPNPAMDLTRIGSRYYSLAYQRLEQVYRRAGILGSCFLHRRKLLCTRLAHDISACVLALFQDPMANTYIDEDNRMLQRRGAKIRDMMLRQRPKLIGPKEFKQRAYPNSFLGHDMIELLLAKGELRTRDAGRKLGERLLQTGVIHHVRNEQQFSDDANNLYIFDVDERRTGGLGQPPFRAPSSESQLGGGGLAGATAAGGSGAASEARPLILTGHGRDARTAANKSGLRLPPGVHLLPVFLEPGQIEAHGGTLPADGKGSDKEVTVTTVVDAVSADGLPDNSKANDRSSAPFGPEPERVAMSLYVQGLGNTEFAAIMPLPHAKDQKYIDRLAVEVHAAISELDGSLNAEQRADGAVDREWLQPAVEEYNFLSFDSQSRNIAGWCNTDCNSPEMATLPDTDDDRIFVNAVSEMHSIFSEAEDYEDQPQVMEMILRKGVNTPVYGMSSFGNESYIQLRQPVYSDPRGADQLHPFDDDFAYMPEIAKIRLGRHGAVGL